MEFLKNPYFLSDDCYRVMFFRYITFVALGCYMAQYEFRMQYIWLILMFTAGIIYIISNRYLGCKSMIFNLWSGTSMVVALYLFPVAYLLKASKFNLRCKLLEYIGRASYFIFIVQMILYRNPSINIIYNAPIKRKFQILLILIVTISIGIIFYFIDGVTQKCIDTMSKKLNVKEN